MVNLNRHRVVTLTGIYTSARNKVSILILLDVVLEAEPKHLLTIQGQSFNPYSVGCCSGSFIVYF